MRKTHELTRPKTSLRSLLAAALAGMALQAQAGRPLASDDAAVDEPGECHLEAWGEHAGDQRAWVLAPACGIGQGLELGAELARPSPRNGVSLTTALSLKWAPDWAGLATPLGKLRFGATLSTEQLRLQGGGWESTGYGATAIATLQASENVNLHANLGTLRDRASRSSAGLLNLALEWASSSSAVLFAEVQAGNRSELVGPTLRTVGGRWWLLPETLGLDLTAGRAAGGGPTLWTFGIGWYGLGWK